MPPPPPLLEPCPPGLVARCLVYADVRLLHIPMTYRTNRYVLDLAVVGMLWTVDLDMSSSIDQWALLSYTIFLGVPFGTSFKAMLAVHLEQNGAFNADVLFFPHIAAIACLTLGVLARVYAYIDRKVKQRQKRRSALILVLVSLPILVAAGYVSFLWIMFLRVAWGKPTNTFLGEDDHNYSAGIFALAPDGNWLKAMAPIWILFGGWVLCLNIGVWRAYCAEATTILGHPASYSIQKRMANYAPLLGVVVAAVSMTRNLDYRSIHTPSGLAVCIPMVVFELLALVNLVAVGVRALLYKRISPPPAELVAGSPMKAPVLHLQLQNGEGQRFGARGGTALADRSLVSTQVRVSGEGGGSNEVSAGAHTDGNAITTKNRAPPSSATPASPSVATMSASSSPGGSSVAGGSPSQGGTIASDHTSLDISVRDSGETNRSDLEESIVLEDSNSMLAAGQQAISRLANSMGSARISNGGGMASEPHSQMSICSWGNGTTMMSMADFAGAPRASSNLSDLFKSSKPLTQPSGGGLVLRRNGSKNTALANRESAVSITSGAGTDMFAEGGGRSIANTSIGGSIGGGTDTMGTTISLPGETGGIAGVRLSSRLVKLGMRVFVDAQYADPHAGLYGDTVSCDGMLGIVEKCDNSETCKCKLADGRSQWIQCTALTQISDGIDATRLEALSGTQNISQILRNLSTQIGSVVAVSPTLERLAMAVIANEPDNAREICAALRSGEIDTLIDGKGLLHAATEHNLLEIVTILLTAGAGPNLRDDEENTPLHWAFITKGHADGAAVAASLIDAGANLDAVNQSGLTPLHIAAGKGHLVGTEILIALSCQVDVPSLAQNETPIFYAMKALATEIIKLLVEQGACNINACDGDGDTPLHLSFYIARRLPEFIQVSEYLIEHGANAAAINQQGVSAIDSCPDEYRERIKEKFVAVAVAKLMTAPSGTADFNVGDRVRLRFASTEPKHGYQGVNPDDTLIVRAIDRSTGIVKVSFVDPSILLIFDVDELCAVFDTSGVMLTTSSSQDLSLNMFDSNRETFWQSDGARGEHWVLIEMPDLVELLALEVLPHRGGVAFIPKKIEVQTAEQQGSLRTQVTSQTTTYGWTALVPAHQSNGLPARYIKLVIRTCHEGGINCRIAGLRMLFRRNQQDVWAPSLSPTVPFDPLQWEDLCKGEESGKLLKSRYRLGRKIAQGGFGVTYMATDEDCLNEQVVIKFLHRLPGLALFRSEARRLLELDHPQIPKLKAYFELKDEEHPDDHSRSKFTMVMEMVHGRNLVELMDDEGPWQDGAVYNMIISLLSILSHVHRKGVIHRDIKAANVMRRERDGVFFLVDFGACTYETDERSQKLIGTPGYMAPEAHAGNSCCESDLFGLGALGLFMLKGQQPSRLVDKAQPSMPYDYVLMQLRESQAISDCTLALLRALLQNSPHVRRSELEALALDLSGQHSATA